MIRILISLGADPMVKDATGKSSIDYINHKQDQTSKNIKRMLNKKISKAGWTSE